MNPLADRGLPSRHSILSILRLAVIIDRFHGVRNRLIFSVIQKLKNCLR